MIDGEAAVRALKHFDPDVIRLIRGAFDVGSTVKELRKLAKGERAEWVLAAIDYMAVHPNVGKIRWIEGSQYTWDEGETAKIVVSGEPTLFDNEEQTP